MHLFVYGTLKRGYHNHAKYMTKAEFLNDHVLDGYALKYFSLPEGYTPIPVMVPEQGSAVYGEIYNVGNEDMKAIRALEADYIETRIRTINENFITFLGGEYAQALVPSKPLTSNIYVYTGSI